MLDISHLNEAQQQAVTSPDGPLLIIAGAGSGKTRTLVYRLAWLAEQGISPASMLLLTFTRKASTEMLSRASRLLERQLSGLQGGTFHAFAFSVLRRYPPRWAGLSLGIMDSPDSIAALQHCREDLQAGKGDRSFPKNQAVLSLISKSRNKELPLDSLLALEAQHLLPHAEELQKLADAYVAYKREHSLLDYDDLLFELERLFQDEPTLLAQQRARFSYIMVDEYQDTNKVQARLVRILAGENGNIMAVGDDAQSIYAFRGATVRNILDFPQIFPTARIVRLEENYRSVQPILNIANTLLRNSSEGYRKRLFSHRPVPKEPVVRLYRPLSDLTQAQMAAHRIEELLESHQPEEIAVLFRSGFQSYRLEVELNRLGISFKKYGGMRYVEAAHVKDVLAYVRLVDNPMDSISFERVSALTKGIGPKTSRRLFDLLVKGDAESFQKLCKKYPDFLDKIAFIRELRLGKPSPQEILLRILEDYRPKLEELFPEDWPRRLQGLEEMAAIASSYDDLSLFISDLALEAPEDPEEDTGRAVTLSTVHSSKGLEWEAVLLIDLVEERFPTRHAMVRPENFEEERRLMYVACTRAKDSLDLYSPLSLYSKISGGNEPAQASPFVRELSPADVKEIREDFTSFISQQDSVRSSQSSFARESWEREENGPDTGTESSITRLFASVAKRREKRQSGLSSPSRGEYFFIDNQAQDMDNRAQDKEDNDFEKEESRGSSSVPPTKLGFCRHRIFGRGKIVEEIPPDRYRVNFPGFGLKTIIKDYLILE